MSKWFLERLEDSPAGEKRWSVGVNGPRAYLTTDEDTARLIAAAPDLLAALTLALPCVEYAAIVTAANGETSAHEKCLTALEWARAAIAKAKGGVS